MKDLQLLSVGAWAPFDHIFRMSRYPQEGETIPLEMDIADALQVHYGDCSLNIAAAAAALGIKTGIATIVGEDFPASGYPKHLESLGVDQSGITVRSGQLSGHNHLYFDGNGDGFCFSHLGAAEHQDDLFVDPDLIARAQHVVVSEKFSPYTLDALQRAKGLGAATTLNGMLETAGGLLEDFLRFGDILFINRSEFSRLLEMCGGEDRLFGRYDIKLVFVTMGRKGCRILSPFGNGTVDICRAPGKTDTTGAGDSFAAGTIAALIKGYPPKKAAQVGATVSSFVIEKWGCQTNLPDWQHMSIRYAENYREMV